MTNSARASVITQGSVIADTYEVDGLLGKGGMGSVFRAKHTRLPGKFVAIKVLHQDVTDGEMLARFRREAEIASKLGHPNIVSVLDFNNLPDGTAYLVLEYLKGESLAERLAGGALPTQGALAIARQIGSALAAAHREGIVHRDLKPANVFVIATTHEGAASEIAKVLDFGISKIQGSNTVKTQTHVMLGTPQYMAPEQALGKQDLVDGRTDQFALAAIVYEMLTGRPPFTGDSIPELVFKVVYEAPPDLAATRHAQGLPPLPDGMVEVIMQALHKDCAARFPDITAFITALTGRGLADSTPRLYAPRALDAVTNPTGYAATLATGQTPGPTTTPGASEPLRVPTAPTVDDRRRGDAPLTVPDVTDASHATAAPHLAKPPASRRRIWLALALVAGTAGATVATIKLLGPSTNSTKPPATVVTPPPQPPPPASTMANTPAAAAAAQPAPDPDDDAPDADEQPAAASPKVAIVPAKPNPRTKPPKPATRAPAEPSDDPVAAVRTSPTLRAAMDAYASGAADEAKRLAHQVIDRETGEAGGEAKLIVGKIACKNGDLAAAGVIYQQVKGPVRARLVRYCKKLGVTLQ